MGETEDAKLLWDELPGSLRSDLTLKLEGLYGQTDNRRAFDALTGDKQQALLLFAHRLRELNLWREIENIGNVYGLGGVGMNFLAQPTLASTLAAHRQFSTRFARHGDCAAGFIETGRTRATLHFLRMQKDAHLWAVHFDWHAPATSPLSALRHLWHEKWRGATPDWRAIKAAIV